MDKNLSKVTRAMIHIAQGDFNPTLYMVPSKDDSDTIRAVLSGLSMVCEELRETTVPKSFTKRILNAVSDMVFIISDEGAIQEVNRAVCDQLGYSMEYLKGRSIEELQAPGYPSLYSHLKSEGEITISGQCLYTNRGEYLPVKLTACYSFGSEILLTAKPLDPLANPGMNTSELPRLTPREQQILQLISDGHTTNKEISVELGTSIRTVEGQRRKLLQKFGARNAAELLQMARRAHILMK